LAYKKAREASRYKPNFRDLSAWAKIAFAEIQATVESSLIHYAFAVHEGHESYAIMLASARDKGADVFEASTVVLTFIRDGIGRTAFYGDKEHFVLVRGCMDGAAWKQELEGACRQLEVDAEILGRLFSSTTPRTPGEAKVRKERRRNKNKSKADQPSVPGP